MTDVVHESAAPHALRASRGVLYFPFIEFCDDAWVKSALTLWDHVYRIVPEGYSPSDSDEIAKQSTPTAFGAFTLLMAIGTGLPKNTKRSCNVSPFFPTA
jgi:hypothetical protein